VALKLEDAPEAGEGPGAGQLVEGQHLAGSVYHDRVWDFGYRLVDIASTLNMNTVDAQIPDRDGCVRGRLRFPPQVVLCNIGQRIIFVENADCGRGGRGRDGEGTSGILLGGATSYVRIRGG